MSNFNCEVCGSPIIEGENGVYVTCCNHYPMEVLCKYNKTAVLSAAGTFFELPDIKYGILNHEGGLMEIIDIEYKDITLKNFGRRPTTKNDIRALFSLCERTPGNILEIGTWYGKTTYELAVRYPGKTVHTVDFLENELTCECERTTRASKEDLCKYAKHLSNVKFYYLESSCFHYDERNITMVFIDGDHSYEGVKADTENALLYLKTNGGIIAWHDSLNGRFGVPHYLLKEIDPCFERYLFRDSQISYIKI